MNAWKSCLKGLAVPAAALVLAAGYLPAAGAQDREKAAQAEAPQANYSKEFRKLGAPVQALVNEKKWAEVLAALPQFASLPAPTPDDLKAIATWRLQAAQGVGDADEFAAAIEEFLAKGYAEPQNVGAMHRQLAAHYSAKKDNAKTLEHFQKYIETDTEVAPEDFETLGRLYMQNSQYVEACQNLGKAIDLAKSRSEKPKEMWFQLRDRCFIETKDDGARSSATDHATSSSNEIGAFYAGSMARVLGLVPAVVLGGCVTMGVAAVTAWRAPRLRGLHLGQLR